MKHGKFDPEMLRGMPRIWRECLEGVITELLRSTNSIGGGIINSLDNAAGTQFVADTSEADSTIQYLLTVPKPYFSQPSIPTDWVLEELDYGNQANGYTDNTEDVVYYLDDGDYPYPDTFEYGSPYSQTYGDNTEFDFCDCCPCPMYCNDQTGTTYTVLQGDDGNLVSFNNASPVAVTLPQAGSAGFPAGWWTELTNIGAGTATVTPTTSTINSASSVVLTTGKSVLLVSDGVNYCARISTSTGSTGTVTSVGVSMPSPFSVSGSPVTTSGTITVTIPNQSPNVIYAGPSSGGSAAPAFRALVPADIPSLSGTYATGGGSSLTGGTGTGTSGTTTSGFVQIGSWSSSGSVILAATLINTGPNTLSYKFTYTASDGSGTSTLGPFTLGNGSTVNFFVPSVTGGTAISSCNLQVENGSGATGWSLYATAVG